MSSAIPKKTTACVTALFPSSCLWIGDPLSNRALAFQQARLQLGLSPCQQRSYRELGALDGEWDEVRLDSPGKCLQIESYLLALGGFSVGSPAKGRLWSPAAWFAGFTHLLNQLPGHWPYHNPPADILGLLDKRVCSQRLRQAGLPTAACLEQVHDGSDLRRKMSERGWDGAFVKLFCGSSCSGSLAYQFSRGAAFTPLERVAAGHYYNSRRVSRYEGAVAVELVDWLCGQGAQVEEWLPKARLEGIPFDVRLLMIGGEPCHRVVRQGRTPMLGLHLGARRGNARLLDWETAEGLGRQVAAVFPGCLYLGVDLLLGPSGQWVVVEVNAFGDLLPNVLWRGQDTYTAELQAEIRRRGSRPTEREAYPL